MIVSIVLGAGSSSRMGSDKLLLKVCGKTLLEMTLDNLVRSSTDRICAVVRRSIAEDTGLLSRYPEGRVNFVVLDQSDSMSTSLKLGWRFALSKWKPEGLAIMLADKVLVDYTIVNRIIREYHESHCDICVPTFRGRWGHPVILSPKLTPEVMAVSGDRGARQILLGHSDTLHEVQVDSDVILFDVNTEEDLEELKLRLTTDG